MTSDWMTSEPTVSIVVPCYNAADTLLETLQTLQAQSLESWEAVCVDDGSTDGTREILERVARHDPRIRVLTGSHAGPAVARNQGLRAVRSRHVFFFDADDLLHPYALDMLTRISAAWGGEVVVAGGYELLDSQGRALGLFRFPRPGRMSLDAQLHGNCTTRISLPVDWLGADPFDPAVVPCEDEGLWLALAARRVEATVAPRVLFGRRLLRGSIAHHATRRFAGARLLLERWIPQSTDPAVFRDRAQRLAVQCGAIAFAAGDDAALAAFLAELPPLSPTDGFDEAAANAIHWAFLFTHGADGHTWATHADIWMRQIEPWLTSGPLAARADSILACLARRLRSRAEDPEFVCRLLAHRPDIRRVVVYGVGTNGAPLIETLRRRTSGQRLSLAVADDHASDLTFELLELPRTDPRQWRRWPAGTLVLVTPNESQAMVDRLRRAGGRPEHDFVNLSVAAGQCEPAAC